VRSSVRTGTLLAALGVAFLLLSVPAIGQEQGSEAPKEAEKTAPEREKSLQEYREILSSRNRDTMHPGDPLLLIGVDQDGNDMRKNTPILEQSDRKVVMVDQQEAYERALALYAAGAMYKSPLPAAAPDSEVASAPKRAPRASSRGAAVEAGPQWPWFVATAICVAFIVWLGRRFAAPSKHADPA
jgi:hypothetical protein